MRAPPTGFLQQTERKPLENVGFSPVRRPKKNRAIPPAPFRIGLFAFLVPLWTKFPNHSRKKEKAFVRRRTFRLQNGARRGFFAPVHEHFQFERLRVSNRKFPVRVRADSGSLAVTFPLLRGAGILGSLAAMTPLDAHSREVSPRRRYCPRPFFYESEALKKTFFHKFDT